LRKLLILTAFLVLLSTGSSAFAGCNYCNPGCVPVTSGITGWTNCSSNASGCQLFGSTCTTGGGGGTGCGWDPDCEQGLVVKPQEYRLAAVVAVPAARRDVQWQIVSVQTLSAPLTNHNVAKPL